MEPIALLPGLYRINIDTKNPAVDRRVNSDWRVMHFPAGGVLLCQHTVDRESPTSIRVDLYPVRGLAGRYASTHNMTIGWRRSANSMNVTFIEAGGETRNIAPLLAVLEPMPVDNIDDALTVFNGQSRETVSWEYVAATLLAESGDATRDVFERTAKRLAEFAAITEGQTWQEYEACHTAFAKKAYRASPAEFEGVAEPNYAIRERGQIYVCEHCGREFETGPAALASEKFQAHLPCKGPVNT